MSLVPFPFTSGSGGKVRPALVDRSDHNNQRLNDTIVAAVTKTIHRASREATQFLIDIATPEGRQSGLLHTSAVKCEYLATLDRQLILRVVGRLTPAMMAQVDLCLKAALALP